MGPLTDRQARAAWDAAGWSEAPVPPERRTPAEVAEQEARERAQLQQYVEDSGGLLTLDMQNAPPAS